MDQEVIWDAEAARTYDTPGEGMFAADVVEATATRLAALAGGGRALEFAIGTGRIAIPLAEKGVPVTGIELSEPMIARLREKEKADGDAIPVIHGDMATTRASGDYSLVYLIFNTIGNLLTQEEQVECFRNAARHLTPGGRFVVELGVPALRKMPPGQPGVIFAASPGYVGVDSYDLVKQHLVSYHFRFAEDIGDGREARVSRTPQRYVWPSELDLMGTASRVHPGVPARGLERVGVHGRVPLARVGVPAARIARDKQT